MKYVRVDGDVAYIQLTRGQEAVIDAADVPQVVRETWHVVPNAMGGYYARSAGGIYLHRLLLNPPADHQVDHIDNDTLNNRRANLRVVTNQQNNENRGGAYRTSKTGIRGVTIHKCRPSGLMYAANVNARGKHYAKYFPYTPAGLADAAQAVEAMRRELMPYSVNKTAATQEAPT